MAKQVMCRSCGRKITVSRYDRVARCSCGRSYNIASTSASNYHYDNSTLFICPMFFDEGTSESSSYGGGSGGGAGSSRSWDDDDRKSSYYDSSSSYDYSSSDSGSSDSGCGSCD